MNLLNVFLFIVNICLFRLDRFLMVVSGVFWWQDCNKRTEMAFYVTKERIINV